MADDSIQINEIEQELLRQLAGDEGVPPEDLSGLDVDEAREALTDSADELIGEEESLRAYDLIRELQENHRHIVDVLKSSPAVESKRDGRQRVWRSKMVTWFAIGVLSVSCAALFGVIAKELIWGITPSSANCIQTATMSCPPASPHAGSLTNWAQTLLASLIGGAIGYLFGSSR